ncbi:hypothetical protein ACTXJX_10240 [Glutamicibacter ardleyensis]|uniref:hypothetical protein n=1 Tax=Glutamicibacter ardleyensis TaxID=225894 RepID=UPI003FD446E3
MTGRVDRKYCSAACRQKAYRKSQSVATTNKVTAEPFDLDTRNVYYKKPEEFWGTLFTLEEFRMIDQDENGDRIHWQVPAYPPREKKLEGRDLKRSLDELREFIGNYDQIAGNLARFRATAEAILKFHEATSSNVTDASIQQPATFGDEIKQIVREANAEAARLRSETP